MLRGLIFGVIWGTVVSGIGLAAISLISAPPAPIGEAPDSADVSVPAGSEFNKPLPDARPVIPGSEDNDGVNEAPLVAEGETEDAPLADTSTASAPTGEGTQAPETPTSPEVAEPVLDLNVGAPEDENGTAIDTLAITDDVTDGESIPNTPEQLEIETAEVTSVDPVQPQSNETAPSSPEVALPQDQNDAGDALTEGTAEDTGAQVEVVEEETPQTETVAEDLNAPSEEDETQTALANTDPQPATQLPTIGGDNDADAAQDETQAEADESSAEETEGVEGEDTITFTEPGLGALARNAAPFRPDGDKPLMSIILIDVIGEGLDRTGLSTFPFPITIAIDPADPEAAESARAYREAGLEVLIQSQPLPSDIAPSELAADLSLLVSSFPDAIGVIDAPADGFQSNRRLISSVVQTLADGGHGLVTYDRGLNTAMQVAQKEGLPSGIVYRTLDAERENSQTINRYLERARIRAGQEGHVIMIGHSYTDTVTAIYTWMSSQGAQSVSLAPLSVILRK